MSKGLSPPMSKGISPLWYTIEEFQQITPLNLYHKEQEELKEQKGKMVGIQNLHVLTRAVFTVEEIKNLTLYISADDYFKLYINGEFITQGPPPAYPEAYYYQRINLIPYLQKGKNVLALHLYYQGLVNRVWNSGDNRFAFYAEIRDIDNSKLELEWKYEISKAYDGKVTGYDTQFLENFDSREWNESWNQVDFEDEDWCNMVVANWADYELIEQREKPLSIYYRNPKEIVKSSGMWFMDAGEEITGALCIRAVGKEGSKIHIRCGEECYDNFRVRYEMRCNCCYEEVWTLKEGECYLEPYDYKGFRYVELLFDETVRIQEVKFLVRHYPMEEESCILESSAPYLNSIFRICKNAVKYGTQEGYLDCPTREKGQYLGDAFVTAHSQVWLSGSTELLRKCIRQFALSSSICPGLMGVVPGGLMQEIADFSLLWPELLLLDYQFTKDTEFLQEQYPVLLNLVEYFSKYEREDGLLNQVSEKWNLVDWPEHYRDHYDFTLSRPVVAPGCHNVINALYFGAVNTLCKVEEILGLQTDREQQVEKLKNSYIQAFYRPKKRLFADSEISNHCSLHSNVYPLYFGLVGKTESKPMIDFIMEKGLCCGTYFSYFILKSLARTGNVNLVYELLVNETSNGWVNMLREGATTCWEAWGKEQKWNTSLCHPWASAPIVILIEDIGGFVLDPEKECGYVWEPVEINRLEEEDFVLEYFFQGHQYQISKKKKQAWQLNVLK